MRGAGRVEERRCDRFEVLSKSEPTLGVECFVTFSPTSCKTRCKRTSRPSASHESLLTQWAGSDGPTISLVPRLSSTAGLASPRVDTADTSALLARAFIQVHAHVSCPSFISSSLSRLLSRSLLSKGHHTLSTLALPPLIPQDVGQNIDPVNLHDRRPPPDRIVSSAHLRTTKTHRARHPTDKSA